MTCRRGGWSVGPVLLLLAGCGSAGLEPGSDPAPPAEVPVLLSEVAGEGELTSTWVSMPPGTVPGGTEALLTTRLANGRLSVPLIDGGFDPVALAARLRDTAEVTVRDSAGAATTTIAALPARTWPGIVRTNPPRRKRDVPLSLRALVVFSEPMDPQTVNPGTIRLLRGGVAVPGTVTRATTGLQAEFVPIAPLTPLTDYVLEVTTGVTDLAGDPLLAPFTVEFTTASTDPGPAHLSIRPDSIFLLGGATRLLEAAATDSAGRALPAASTWRSADWTIALLRGVSPWEGPQHQVTVTGLGWGETTISATQGGTAGTAYARVLPAAALGIGEFHSCALDAEGRAHCWGNDYLDHLGVPANETCGMSVNGDLGCLTEATSLPTALRFTALAAGEFFTCGLATEGAGYCWGSGRAGNLGDADTLNHVRTSPVAVAGRHAFTQLVAGASHACGLTSAGQAWCWGSNERGQLGDGSGTDQGTPVPVAGNHRFTSLGAWWKHTCGVDVDGQGWCWGGNTEGQLGTGDRLDHPVPAAVSGSLRFATIAPGLRHTCGRTTDGRAYCWGSNLTGALGTDGGESVSAPVPVATPLRFSELDAGNGFSCGLASADGSAWCWGTIDDGPMDQRPVAVRGLTQTAFTGLGLGHYHACGLTAEERIACWGGDFAAQTRPFRRP